MTPSSGPSLHQPNLFVQTPQALQALKPLAEQLRPTCIGEVLGQEALLAPGKPLHTLFSQGRVVSLLLWGQPGLGKTTLARLLAKAANLPFESLSATSSGVKELREVIERAEQRVKQLGQPTVLFLDECHRYNKGQQDALLPYVEQGTLVLIGATTENPSFQVNSALLSRLLVFKLEPLSEHHLEQLLNKGLAHLKAPFSVSGAAKTALLRYATGDARRLLTALEALAACYASSKREEAAQALSVEAVQSVLQQAVVRYDNQGDSHYDIASAFQKSMRGSDADAAIYWLARMIEGGEDPRFISRRLVVTAAEDVGMADPQALLLAETAARACEHLGWPEARIPLALAVIYVAKAPKNNTAITAIDAALADLKQGHVYEVPVHLRDSHYAGAAAYGHGQGYVYTHNNPQAPQTFLPEPLLGKRYV
jgi:putative ATPase